MKRNRILKLISTAIFGCTLTIGLTSCGSNGNNGEFTTFSSTNFLTDNNSPLNNGFNNSPISTYAQSELLSLTTYQTVGQFEFQNEEVSSTPSDLLLLEGAKAAIVFKDVSTKEDFDNAMKSKISSFDTSQGYLSDQDYNNVLDVLKSGSLVIDDTTNSILQEGTDYWVFTRDRGALQLQNGLLTDPEDFTNPDVTVNTTTDYYNNAISNGTVYQFIIDTDNQWVDGSGKVQAQVSSKDFERTIEAYTMSSDLNYNRNGYFLTLLGLDFDETCGYPALEGSSDFYKNADGSRNWENFNIDNYQSANDSIFTFYIETAYPYTFGLLSKEYFSAMPHTNPKVENINMKDGYIKTTTAEGTISIDQQNTNWNELYGSGGVGQFTKDTWYAGAYRISSFTNDTIVFELNNIYLETAGRNLLDSVTGSRNVTSTEKKINKIVYVFGSGTTDTFYEQFKSKQNDYLPAVPSDKTSEAVSLFLNKGLVIQKTVKATQSNYIVYTPNPYIASGDSVQRNQNINENTANFIYQWNSENSYLIRAAITGLINWYQLSLINITSGDFQLSATPYGVLSDYYENVANGNLFGGLPRPWTDYKDSSNDILDQFTLPYYDYSAKDTSNNATVDVKELTVNQDTLKSALQAEGATTNSPLIFSIKFGEGSFDANYSAELNRMKSVIEQLSGGLISVVINQRDSSNPTAMEWYNTQSSPLGFSYWSPDYNGVGTWIEADTTLQTANNKEAVPATNSHNSWITFLSTMVAAVKTSGATLTEDSTTGTKLYSMPTNYISTATANVFDKDSRITKAFSNDSLSAMGITLKPNSEITNSQNVEDSAVSQTITPGQRYALVAIGLLNTLISQGVFNADNFQEYVTDPSKLVYSSSSPQSLDQLYIGNDIINANQSEGFSKWIGVYAGQSSINALFENNVLDSDYSYLPRSEAGLNELIYTLVNPNYVARSGTQNLNFRDFGWKV